MAGDVVAGRYILEKIVGEGSYSRVFMGFDNQKQRKVAIKEMRNASVPDSDRGDEAQRIFFRELNTLKLLRHKAIPRVYDFFLFRGRQYMVMEWADGENLESLLEKEGRIPEMKALSIMEQVCEVLIYLQGEERRIVYKDLKPSNIIIGELGTVKIIDFGTARTYSPEKKKDTQVLGTPGYAPPEAYREDVQTDLSADVYSLGATIYHLVTGEDPVHFRFQFPDPRQYNDELTRKFSTLLLKCLELRDKRIPNATALMKHICNCRNKAYINRNSQETPDFHHSKNPVNVFLMLILFAVTNAYICISSDISNLFQLRSFYFMAYYFLMVVFFPVIIIHYIVVQANRALDNKYKNNLVLFMITALSYLLIMSLSYILIRSISGIFINPSLPNLPANGAKNIYFLRLIVDFMGFLGVEKAFVVTHNCCYVLTGFPECDKM